MNKKTLLLYLAATSIVSCTHSKHKTQDHSGPTFQISGPVRQDTTINKAYVSQIHAFQHIELRALEKGYLHKILVDEGQHVKKGQLLFQIQPTIYIAEAQRAESEVEFARVEYQNTSALANQNIVSQSEVALAKAQLEKSKAELALAEAHLSFTKIYAPFDGIVGKFEDVRLGSLLDEGELLTTLSDNSKMWVYFNVPEAEYLDYAIQKKDSKEHVYLQLANHAIFPLEGIVETMGSDFNNKTGNISFRATFSNPDGLLRHGQTGTILWPKLLKNVTMIPQKATFEILEKKYVFLVNDEGVVHASEVKIEDEINHIYLVRSGLQSTDRFLLEGLRKVSNGDHIHFKFIEPQHVLADLHLHAE